MINPEHYIYCATWSEEDQEFVGLCTKFPSLSWLAETQQGALSGIVDLVRSVVVDMAAVNELVPKPISHRHFSGKFQLRISPKQ